jgi:nucleoside-triphosphatase THEP1
MIYILSGPVNSGKTTQLFNFAAKRNDVFGFLCPYIDGKRCIFDLRYGIYYPLELDEKKVDSIEIGRFVFDKAGFLRMHDILESAFTRKEMNWFIIDEIGKLEIRDLGLEPALSHFIEKYKSIETKKPFNLLLVIRDYLFEDVIKKYNLQEARLIEDIEFFMGN